LGAENVDLARYRMLREVYELLDSLTREFPLLLSLGDLHWADCTKTGEASSNCLEVTSERNNLVMPKARTAVG
jgi:hypothetical protein